MKDVAAIVLAAGRAERMGHFKPLLPFGDSTVIDHCIDNLRGGGVESIVVVAGHRATDLQDHLQAANITFAVNPEANSEMSDSLACGVTQIPANAKAILITPADHPAVPTAVVRRIIDSWRKGAHIVIPTWAERGGHPVLVDSAFRDRLLNLDPDRGLRGFFESNPEQVVRLPVDSSYVARDMDTWDDYISLHKEVFGVPPEQPFDRREPQHPLARESN